MTVLDIELAAYRGQQAELEEHDIGRWVVFHNAKRVGLFDTFETAAVQAVKLYGRGPYLIRQVGAPPVALPICVVQRRNG